MKFESINTTESLPAAYRVTPEQLAAVASGRFEHVKLGVLQMAAQQLASARRWIKPWKCLPRRNLILAEKYLRVEIKRLKDKIKQLAALGGSAKAAPNSRRRPVVFHSTELDARAATASAIQVLRSAQASLESFQVYPPRYLAGAIADLVAAEVAHVPKGLSEKTNAPESR